jgi:integrase
MGRFRSSRSQAKGAVKRLLAIGKPKIVKNDGKIHSLGTLRAHTDALTGLAEFIKKYRLFPRGKGLADLNVHVALSYLEMRSQIVGQSALDKDRRAMNLQLGIELPTLKSELDEAKTSRAYPFDQVNLILNSQSPKHSFSTQLVWDGGLRAHELYTIMRIEERAATSDREWRDDRFHGLDDNVIYSVAGKGGLIREVAFSTDHANQLETLRLDVPRIVTDRGIYYTQYYDIGGGKQWSDSFSKASTRVLGWSNAGHGLRHSYAQNRMRTLMRLGYCYDVALEIVSQEMGHFRPDITLVYLR